MHLMQVGDCLLLFKIQKNILLDFALSKTKN